MKILIVDDSADTLQMLEMLLDWRILGFDSVLCAQSVQEARRVYLQEQPNLILCDIEMPRESGISFLEWMRQEGYDTAFIFLTCHAKFEFAQRAVSLGSEEYLLKPVTVKALKNAVLKATKRFRPLEAPVESAVYQSPDFEQFTTLLATHQYNRAGEYMENCIMSPSFTSKCALKRFRIEFLQCIYRQIDENGLKAQSVYNMHNDTLAMNVDSSAERMLIWVLDTIRLFGDAVQEINAEKSLHVRIRKYIEDNYMRNVSMQDLAKFALCNADYLARIFKKAKGITPMAYLTEVRVGKAKTLLLGPNISISEVYLLAGFNSFSYFNRVFRKSTGMSPREFRKKSMEGIG